MTTKTTLTMLILGMQFSYGQVIFNTDKNSLEIKTDKKISTWNWASDKEKIKEIETTKKKIKITLSDGKNQQTIGLKRNIPTDIWFINAQNDTLRTQIKAVAPNITFSKKYVQKHQGKTFVAIPEVSELVNILMALHSDAEKDSNMFDTQTDYFKRIKKHFAPYLKHPAMDTIHKYITKVALNESNEYMFPIKDYYYYYGLKMNACVYEFDKKGNIVNSGNIKQLAKGWTAFDPMKDAKVFADFAQKSNFRQFYKDNQSYYSQLISDYKRLNPIQKMQNWLDAKFGFGYGSYMVYFSPLVQGAHSTVRYEDNGLSQTFMFICKAEDDQGLSPIQNEIKQGRVVFTEIDHNYVNPLSDTMVEDINKVFADREKWAKSEITTAYNNAYKVFNEYMTFAVYSLYLWDNYSEEEVLGFLPSMEAQMEQDRGFNRFKVFNRALLTKYKENPNISMKDLYQYILKESEKM